MGGGGGRKVVFLEVCAYYRDVRDVNICMHQQNVQCYVLRHRRGRTPFTSE